MTDDQEYAPSWQREETPEISGRIVQVDSRTNEWGTYPILTLEDEGGTQLAVHCVHSVLRREIARNYDPTSIIGQQIRIKYLGRSVVQSGKFAGREFHNYKVFGGNRAYDWSQDLPEDERGSASAFGAGSSGRATAEPPIQAKPLAPSNEPSVRQKAEENFGAEAPF